MLLQILVTFLLVALSESRVVHKRQAAIGTNERKVFCYYTNWSFYRSGIGKFTPKDINPYLCTHLIYAFATFNKEGTGPAPSDMKQDIENRGFKEFAELKKLNENLKTMVAMGGIVEGSERFSNIASTPEARVEFSKKMIKFLREHDFDGINIDWQFPVDREGSRKDDRKNYAELVKTMRGEFEKESADSGLPLLLIAIGIPSETEIVPKGFDLQLMWKYVDFLNVVSYDYHLSTDPYVHHNAPLYPLKGEEDPENENFGLNVDYTISYLLNNGAPAEKIILGIPSYGRSFVLENTNEFLIGAPAEGPGTPGQFTGEAGFQAYYEICTQLKDDKSEWTVRTPNMTAMGPYMYKGKDWIGFDDENIVKKKGQYARDKGLGGIMFWTIDLDDFRGLCHDTANPLIRAGREGLLESKSRNVVENKVDMEPIAMGNAVTTPQTPVASPNLLQLTPNFVTSPDRVTNPPSRRQESNLIPTSQQVNNDVPDFDFTKYLPDLVKTKSTSDKSSTSIFFQNIRTWITNNIFHLYSPS